MPIICNYRASLNLFTRPAKLQLFSVLPHTPPFSKASLTKVVCISGVQLNGVFVVLLCCVWLFIVVVTFWFLVFHIMGFFFNLFSFEMGFAILPSMCSNALPAPAF